MRRLWAKGSGRFRTRGRYASAVIRGTDWLTADRCDSTLVKTRQGVVAVLDLVLKKTVLVKAGQSYSAAKKPKPSAATRTIAGDFAGKMVFRTAGGSIWQTQYARVSVTKRRSLGAMDLWAGAVECAGHLHARSECELPRHIDDGKLYPERQELPHLA